MLSELIKACLGTPYGWWMYGSGVAVGYWIARIRAKT